MPLKKQFDKEAMAPVAQLGMDVNSVGEQIYDDEKE